jgi:hypothetical protein
MYRVVPLLCNDHKRERALLGKAGKHVNNTRAITRQLIGKRVPAETNKHVTMETVFSMWFAPKCNKKSQSSSGIQGCQQLS